MGKRKCEVVRESEIEIDSREWQYLGGSM
jgi:hypothetical protein